MTPQFTLAGYWFRLTLPAMNKLCILAGTTILSYVGWYLGELLGLEFWGCFLLSGVGSIAGVWVGWKVARKFD